MSAGAHLSIAFGASAAAAARLSPVVPSEQAEGPQDSLNAELGGTGGPGAGYGKQVSMARLLGRMRVAWCIVFMCAGQAVHAECSVVGDYEHIAFPLIPPPLIWGATVIAVIICLNKKQHATFTVAHRSLI